MGTYHRNPLMDTRKYELEYNGRTHDCYFSNIIAEKIYSQVDSEGDKFLVLKEIYDHWSDVMDISVADRFIISRCGNNHINKTMRGWELLSQTKEGF